MHETPPRRTRPSRRAVRCAACITLAAAQFQAPPLLAQAAQPAAPAPQAPVYPMQPVRGHVRFRAARASDWTTGPVRRLMLEGDVSATIADYTFRAQRAAVWVREESGADGGRAAHVFVYFDEVGDASQAAGRTTLQVRALPVRAVVELESDLVVDAAVTSPAPFSGNADPTASAFVAAAEAAFAKSLEPAPPNPPPAYSFTPQESRAEPRRWLAEVPGTEAPAQAPSQAPSTTTTQPVGGPETPAKSPVSAHLSQPEVPTQLPQTPPAVVAGPDASELPSPVGPAAVIDINGPDQPVPAPVKVEAPAGETAPAPPAARRAEPLFAKSGTLTLSSGDITIITNAQADPQQPAESAVTCVGGVTILYRDLRGRALQLSAQRAVIFLANAADTPVLSAPMPASAVRGIYLEGAVAASDGTYSIRSPQIFYDLVADKAVMIDAVFSTYSQERGVPLYVRAKEIRQESARQWTARKAVFTNSAFEDPELSIGATTVTIEQRTRPLADPSPLPTGPQSESYFHATADHVTLRAVGVPFFYWPTYAGDPSQPFLRDLRVENRSGSGIALRTAWNAAQLLGLEAPEGTSADLLADVYIDRGPALGARVRWELARHKGDLFAYAIPLDNGTDVLKPGTEISRTDDFRGIITLQDRFVLDRVWTITAEGSYISDEAFVDAFFEEAGETRREFTNRVVAARREDNTLLAFEFKTKFNDFTPNEWLLQSPGYSVSKLPEASYIRIADDLLPRSAPGLLTHFQEYRVGAYAMALDEVTPRSRGFDTDFLAQKAFGLSPDESIAQALRSRGYTEEQISRLDTRQEVTAKLEAGPVHLTPFITARATLYDNTFAAFNPEGNDAARLWTSAGVRASTTLTRIYDGIDSRLLDIHRLRHSITPSVTVWAAGTNVEASDIPTYDPLVDALADGESVRLGLLQTLQTKRGGPGRWIDTDLLRLNTDLVFSSDDTDAGTPLGRFFDSRPEYSALGNFFTADGAYRLTDAASLVGSAVYDFDSHQQDMSSAGVMLTHSPGWSTLVDVRYINPQDSTIVGMWGNYDLLDKYALTLAPSYDAAEGRFQSMFVQFTRRFSALQMSVGVTYNDITSETTFGFVIQPYGARRGAGVEGLGGTNFSGVYAGSGGL